MKMIKAIIRPEVVDRVTNALELGGFPALTKIDVFGRGKQSGIKVGDVVYGNLPKTMLMIVVDDPQVDEATSIIESTAKSGNIGDGRIFVSPVEESIRIRTGERGTHQRVYEIQRFHMKGRHESEAEGEGPHEA
jgi:nitrogen regulatory protein PII 1